MTLVPPLVTSVTHVHQPAPCMIAHVTARSLTHAGGTQWHALSATGVSLAWWHAIRRHARGTVVFVGAVSADMCLGRYPGEMAASAPVCDAEVMLGLGPVPLGRWNSATVER